MRKLALVMFVILALTIVVSCINADACARVRQPRVMQFEEFLQGSVVGSGMTKEYGQWTAVRGELITGTGTGNLMGSPIEFTLISNRRFKMDPHEKGFINGRWTFVLSDGSQISGIFIGKGSAPTEFSGMFVSNKAKNTPKIMGTFSCKFLYPNTYGGSWGYEAWWKGTIKGE